MNYPQIRLWPLLPREFLSVVPVSSWKLLMNVASQLLDRPRLVELNRAVSKIGNTGGMIDNLISCPLSTGKCRFRPVNPVECPMNLITLLPEWLMAFMRVLPLRWSISGTTFMDHLLRFESDPRVKMSVLLGKLEGWRIRHSWAFKSGQLTKTDCGLVYWNVFDNVFNWSSIWSRSLCRKWPWNCRCQEQGPCWIGVNVLLHLKIYLNVSRLYTRIWCHVGNCPGPWAWNTKSSNDYAWAKN